MQCPICNESFDTQKLFSEHLEYHKKQSFLNQIPEPAQIQNSDQSQHRLIDVTNFFGKERFETMVLQKLQNIQDMEELFHRRNFVEQVKKLISRHPFIHIPYFVDDLLYGNESKFLRKKYYISHSLALKNTVHKILKFDRTRYRQKQYDDAFAMNMKIPTWNDKYDILKNNCDFFKDELTELLFLNVLRSFILIIVTDYVNTGISKQDIITKSRQLQNNYNLFKFIDEPLKNSFTKYFENAFDETVLMLVDELILAKILKKKLGNSEMIVGRMSIDNLKESIIRELEYNNGSQSEYEIKDRIKEQYPSLKLLPNLGIWETALNELYHEQMIRFKTDRNGRRSSIIFLNENYQKIQQQIQMFGSGDVKFYGRKITPDQFIDELKDLELGDFKDDDDQVTRIAGLVLAESVNLQAPHEHISQFDFLIDITDYHFRDEQIETMKKLDFKINSRIFHCKVMLHDTLSMQKYEQIKEYLPNGEQAVVITFRKIPSDVKAELEKDDSIQIIDEEGIRIWVSITSKIPSRVGSIAKLHKDPISGLERRLVRINRVNYEDGLATVTVLPDKNDAVVLVRSLEEISLNEEHPKYFETLTCNYMEFLDVLAKLTTLEDLVNGLFNVNMPDSYPKSTSVTMYFENCTTELFLSMHHKDRMLDCGCLRWLENKFYLCPHLIYLIDYTVRTKYLDTWNDKGNLMKSILEKIIIKNISTILDRLGLESQQNDELYNKMKEFILCVYETRKD